MRSSEIYVDVSSPVLSENSLETVLEVQKKGDQSSCLVQDSEQSESFLLYTL